MEEKNMDRAYDPEEAKAYILNKYKEAGDFLEILKEEELISMVADVMALDEAYMKESGADEGAVYDDEAALVYMQAGMNQRYPAHKMYLMRFVEDYLDFNEEFLDSIGAIDWE